MPSCLQVESRSQELDNIRESSLQPRAKKVAARLQKATGSYQAAAQELQEGFGRLVTAIHERQGQALEELRARWKADQQELEQDATEAESHVTGAKTCTAVGRTVTSLGLPAQLAAQSQQLERAVQEARTVAGQPLPSSWHYQVGTSLTSPLSTSSLSSL